MFGLGDRLVIRLVFLYYKSYCILDVTMAIETKIEYSSYSTKSVKILVIPA